MIFKCGFRDGIVEVFSHGTLPGNCRNNALEVQPRESGGI